MSVLPCRFLLVFPSGLCYACFGRSGHQIGTALASPPSAEADFPSSLLSGVSPRLIRLVAGSTTPARGLLDKPVEEPLELRMVLAAFFGVTLYGEDRPTVRRFETFDHSVSGTGVDAQRRGQFADSPGVRTMLSPTDPTSRGSATFRMTFRT